MKDIAVLVGKMLNDYAEEVNKANLDVAKSIAEEARQKVIEASPRRTGEYASGWECEVTETSKGVELKVVNVKMPWLTHILENGHVSLTKKHPVKRVAGIPHIQPVQDWADEAYMERLGDKLDDIN